jgi:hypothetical protein
MSTVKSKKLQVGTDATSSNNFTIYQPASPDGTLRIGVGNADSPTEVARFDSVPSYSARAWVNFNGTGTVAIRASGNVSSITDRGTGIYTVNFATAMPDINYCGATSAIDNISLDNQRNRMANAYSSSVSASYVNSFTTDGAADDVAQINVIYIR